MYGSDKKIKYILTTIAKEWIWVSHIMDRVSKKWIETAIEW